MKNKTKAKKSTKYIIFIAILLVFVITFLLNVFSFNKDGNVDTRIINHSMAAITTFDYSEVTSVESEIKKLELTEAKTTFDATKPLTPAQYQQIFKGNVIIGDSITSGLTAYQFLTEESVYCKIGGSLINGDDIFSSAAEVYPLKAVFAFGINDMLNYNGEISPFISRYEEVIKQFRKKSPGTKIYINSITVPSEDAIKDKPALKKYKEFNTALEKMCKEMNIGFIDNTSIFKDDSLYAGDGIHVTSEYYPLWLNNIIRKAGM